MPTYRSPKNILLQAEDADQPAIEGTYRHETSEFVFDLSAGEAKTYGAALLAEGAIEGESAEVAAEPAEPDAAPTAKRATKRASKATDEPDAAPAEPEEVDEP